MTVDYWGFNVRVINDYGCIGAVVWKGDKWRFKSEREALKWSRKQIEDVFLGRVK